MFRALWNLIKIVIFGFIALFCIVLFWPSSSDKKDSQESTPIETTQVEETKAIEPVEEKITTEPVVEETDIVEENSESSNSLSDTELTYMAASILIDSNLQQAFSKDNYEVKYDKDSITINIWNDGIVQGIVLLKAGLGEESWQSSWDSIKQSAISSCSRWTEEIIEAGIDNPTVIYNIVNDQNHDNVLLSVCNGTLIYDVLND